MPWTNESRQAALEARRAKAGKKASPKKATSKPTSPAKPEPVKDSDSVVVIKDSDASSEDIDRILGIK